ncbi:MAG TPA: hypothetical protein VM283_08080, partial [Armatimonadota bacterium]|nr:hypothetical protein [Armatimonadota bacterium]
HNPGREQRWLEVRLGLPVDAARGWTYWDGRNLPVEVAPDARILSAKAKPVLGDEGCTRLESHYGMNLPLSCVWHEATGVAVGLEPRAPHSYFAGGAEPGLSPADAVYYATQLVIDPGTSETADFVLLAFDPAWGLRDALERMYRAFPDVYRPDPKTDPRVLSNCAITGTALLSLGTQFMWEECRRLGLGWTWGTGARYSGLCYPEDGREQTEQQIKDAYWAFTNPRYTRPSWVKDAIAERGALTPEEHRRYTRETFDAVRNAVAIAYDITTQYLDKGVAESEFADSILTRANDTKVILPNQAIMYAWGNSFGDRHAELVGRMLADLNPPGVHFDNAVGYDVHFGAGVDRSPGRAFDREAGRVYSIEGVAQVMQMALAREHQSGGRRVFVAGNTVGTWFGARLCDASLIESLGPWHDETEPWRGKYTQPGFEHYMALRYLLGSKPLVFCGPAPWSVKLTDEQQKLPYEERTKLWIQAYEDLTRDYPLFAYRVGAPTISYVLRPCANVREHLATVLRLCRAGWRAVPAARADLPELWVERFGEIPGGFVTVGNPTDDTARATVSFDRARCGAVALATDAGYAVPVRVEGGSARAQVELPARTPLAWQIVASLDPTPPDGTAITASVSGEVTRIDLNCPRACQATLTVALPDDHAFGSLLVGEAEVAAEALGAAVRARVSLPEGQSSVELRHPPLYRIASEASDFPFFDGEKCTSAIVLR